MKISKLFFAAILLASLASCDPGDGLYDWYYPDPPPPPGIASFSFNMNGKIYNATTMHATTGMEENGGLPIFNSDYLDQDGNYCTMKIVPFNDINTGIHESDSVEVQFTNTADSVQSFHLVSRNQSFNITWEIVQPGYMSGLFSGVLYPIQNEPSNVDSLSITEGIYENVEM